jgi:hypothetical protein
MTRRAVAICFLVLATASLLGFGATLRDGHVPAAWLTAGEAPADLSAARYASLYGGAAAAGALDLALDAARRETALHPSAAAWHRRAWAATALAGRPDREALSALVSAYEAAPYVAPREAVWRIEFAAAHWASIPDPLQALTLTQMAALAGRGETWDRRREWCDRFPEGALRSAACASIAGPEEQ